MPWFITAITRPRDYKPYQSRCFGFYNDFNDAFKAVEEDRGSMCECLYDYIVMEYIEQGIHSEVHKTYWWQWVDENKRWEDGIEKPYEFLGIVNFALG